MNLNNIQRRETYKGYRIEPDNVIEFVEPCTGNGNKWIVPNVTIYRIEEITEPIKILNFGCLCAATEDEAYHQAVNLGEEEIERMIAAA